MDLFHLLVLCLSVIMFLPCTLGSCEVFNRSSAGLTELPDINGHCTTVDLSGNRIKNLTQLHLEYLTSLDLSNNLIASLDRNVFAHLPNLQSLNLSRNRLQGTTIRDVSFERLDSLTLLNIDRNPLRHIRKDTFNFMQLIGVTHLDLSHCELELVEKGAIDIPRLAYLDLSWNKLNSFTDDNFGALMSLKTLDLSHNNIRVIDDAMIPMMPDLTTWILDSNGMEKVKLSNMHYRIDALGELYLRDNKLRVFGEDDLPFDTESLRVLDLTGNDIQCDCNMKWDPQKLDVDLEGKSFTIRCQVPADMEGKDLLTLSNSDLVCHFPVAKILFIVAVSCMGVVICLIAVYFIVRRRRTYSRLRKAAKGDTKGDFTAIYTRDDDDIRVTIADSKQLLQRPNEEEFDV